MSNIPPSSISICPFFQVLPVLQHQVTRSRHAENVQRRERYAMGGAKPWCAGNTSKIVCIVWNLQSKMWLPYTFGNFGTIWSALANDSSKQPPK